MATAALHVFRDHGSGRTGAEIAPAGLLMVIAFGDPYQVGIGDGPLSTAPRGFVIGAQSRHGRSALTGTADGVQVDLTWSAATTIFGPVAADLADLAVEVADLPGGSEVADRLPETPTAGRTALVAQWLRARRRAHDGPVPLVTRALTRIEEGADSVAALADELGCSRGHLHRVVRAATGQSPSTLIRIVRLHRLIGRWASPGPPGTLALSAALVGYADHAHLCHETRTLAGRSPTELLAHRDRARAG